MLRCLAASLLVTLLSSAAVLSQDARDWASLDQRAEELYTKGDLAEAIRVAKLAVAAAADTKQSAHSLDRLGFFEFTSGNLKDGESFLRQSLELRKSNMGVETADYAESANDLALLCRDAGRLPEAQELAEQAVAIRTRVLGKTHPNLAESLNTLASIVALRGEYDRAISSFEEARAIHETGSDPKEFSEEYGTLCVNLGGTYQRVGLYGKAEELFEKGLDVLRRKPGVNHPAYSASLVAFAYLQADLGHFARAEKLYDESGRLMREQLGEQHAYYAAFLNNRGALYATLGNLTAAEADYRKALDVKRRVHGPDALTVGATLRNLGHLVYARNPREGEQLFKEAIDLYARNSKAPAFDYTSVLLGLGEAQRDRGDLESARQTLQRASEIAAKGLSTKHPLYAAVLGATAQVHRAAREYAQAERSLQEAIDIVKETHGENHPDLARYLRLLGAVYDEAGDARRAEPLYRRSLDVSDRALTDMLTVGSARDKAAVLAIDDPIPALVSFQRRAGDTLPAARALAFEAVARRKGRVLDQVHDWGQGLRDTGDAGIRVRFTQWEAMLECQSSLTVALGYRDLKPVVVGTCALPGTDLAGRYERLLHELRGSWTDARGRQALQAVGVLEQRIGALEAGLSREVPQFGSTRRPARLEDIRSSLEPDELLVEFVAYEPDARGVEPSQRRYGAFLVARSGDVEWADVGPAAAVDRTVQDLITAANDWGASMAGGESRPSQAAQETADDALRNLSAQLRPVLSAAEKKPVKRLRIAPDGMLNLVPFAALSGGGGHPLIDRFAICYVSAGRDLANRAASGRPIGPLVIALSPGAGKRTSAGNGAASAFRADRLERLERAEMEARDLRRRMPRALLLGEGEATEQRLKQLHRPALLHILGHGIVRGNEDCRTAQESPACRLAGIDPAARVMSLSAIVLEEAYGRGGASAQDGLLTALELQTLDLNGSEMLVLSQCRMADGVPSSGEGIFGMRRAAGIAGVKTFIAPLWKVADSTQQTLMERFYRELAAGKGRAEALRQAQLQLLQTRATASFLQWAPVILSGDPAPLPGEIFSR